MTTKTTTTKTTTRKTEKEREREKLIIIITVEGNHAKLNRQLSRDLSRRIYVGRCAPTK